MNMFDEARALRAIMDMRDITQGELAKNIGVSQSYIANKLRLLKLDGKVEEKIKESQISERHARAILRLDNTERQLEAIEIINKRGLTASETESLIDLWYMDGISNRINKQEKAIVRDSFSKEISKGIKNLTSLGIKASETRSYYGNKTYITICIEE